MGATTTTARMTFEEFERLPDQPGKRELLEGELIELPPAKRDHNETSQRIFLLLHAILSAAHSRGDAAELGRAYHEMGYRLPGDGYVQPDVSVTHAEQANGEYFNGAPAIAIEVVSPSNHPREMETKVRVYFDNGALEVWRVYPKTRHVVIHKGGTSRSLGEHDTLTTRLLPGFAPMVRDLLE